MNNGAEEIKRQQQAQQQQQQQRSETLSAEATTAPPRMSNISNSSSGTPASSSSSLSSSTSAATADCSSVSGKSTKEEKKSRTATTLAFHHHTMGPALASGAVQAIFFNPIDRALYLRVIHKRDLWVKENFINPFQGFANAAIYRTISGASYLVLQDYARAALLWMLPSESTEQSPFALQLGVGALAGTANGLLLNQLQIVKFYCWTTNGAFGSTVLKMRKEGGNLIFFRGVSMSILRDIVFGIVYETMRMPHIAQHYGGDTGQFAANTAAGMFACACSAPINYCRNLIYSTPASSCPLSGKQLMSLLSKEVERCATTREKIAILNSRMNVGWGSVRVGVGFGVGQYVFRKCKEFAKDDMTDYD